MPRLLLMRHAKAAVLVTGQTDFDRPLKPIGRRMAAFMARYLADRRLLPERVLASSSVRTRETLDELVPHLVGDFDVRLTRDLYLSSEDHHIDIIRAQGGQARSLMVLGHNPALQDLTLQLASKDSDIDEVEAKFPTGAVAVIDFTCPRWTDIEPGDGKLVAFLRPKELAADLVG